MQHIGHPLVGDGLYGRKQEQSPVAGLLHAAVLVRSIPVPDIIRNSLPVTAGDGRQSPITEKLTADIDGKQNQ